MIRIIIAEDHTIFRQGLKVLLETESDYTIVGEAGDGETALHLVRDLTPDLLITDLSMPGMGGIELSEQLRKDGLKTRIILLTMHSEPEMVRQAFASGVNGYLLKDNAFSDLLYALKTVVNGDTFISPGIAGMLSSVGTGPASLLSRREREVLRLIASGKTNREIAEELCISLKTVETHRTRIMQKLDLHNTADLVRYAIKSGIFA